ncbi:hypothetical protein BaRGS_00021846, partial [Batillaria attramentaria]
FRALLPFTTCVTERESVQYFMVFVYRELEVKVMLVGDAKFDGWQKLAFGEVWAATPDRDIQLRQCDVTVSYSEW